MGNVTWKYEEPGMFWSETGHHLLVVVPANLAGVYRYQVLQEIHDPTNYVSLTSGHRPALRDALDAAEQAATTLETIH